MSRRPDAAFIAAHIDQAATEAEQLLSALLRSSWPGGHTDRFEPVAADWLRRWAQASGPAAPGRRSVETVDCSCAAGRCGICN